MRVVSPPHQEPGRFSRAGFFVVRLPPLSQGIERIYLVTWLLSAKQLN